MTFVKINDSVVEGAVRHRRGADVVEPAVRRRTCARCFVEVAGQRFLRCYADESRRALITAVDLVGDAMCASAVGATVELNCSSGRAVHLRARDAATAAQWAAKMNRPGHAQRAPSSPSALLHKWRFRSEYRFALARSANGASVRLCDVELGQLTQR
jgi:hypothetical protein